MPQMSVSARHTRNPYGSFHGPIEAISHLIFDSLVPSWALWNSSPDTFSGVCSNTPSQGTSAWPQPPTPTPWDKRVIGSLVAPSVNYVCGSPGCPVEAEAEAESGPHKVLASSSIAE